MRNILELVFCLLSSFKGYEEFYEALEMEELESFLKLPGEKPVRSSIIYYDLPSEAVLSIDG